MQVIDSKSLTPLKSALRHLENLGQVLPSIAPILPVETQVEVGHLLSGFIRHASRALHTIKASLREVARTSGSPILTCQDKERCLIHFPRSTVSLRKEADIEGLRKHLGPMFPVFFETSYTPTKDFQEHLSELEDPTPLLNAIDLLDPTPRVRFDGEDSHNEKSQTEET